MKEEKDTDKNSRIIFLDDDLDNELTSKIIGKIYEFNEMDDDFERYINGYSREPIRLIINTPGGSGYNCLSLIDIINASRTPIHTICLNAFSAGFFILIAGHLRFAYPNSHMMYHQLQYEPFGIDIKSVKDGINDVCHIQQIFEDFMLSNTEVTREELRQVYNEKKDWYIRADEALRKGIIDEIIS